MFVKTKQVPIRHTNLKTSQFFKLRFFAIIILLIIIIWTIVYIILFLLPASIKFSYAQDNCVSQFNILPNFLSTDSKEFLLYSKHTKKIKNSPIFSNNLCVKPLLTPKENNNTSLNLKLFGKIPIKQIKIKTTNYPSVSLQSLNEPLPPTESLNLPLTEKDAIFTYSLQTNNIITKCQTSQLNITCPFEELKLTPGTANPLTLLRNFKDSPVEKLFDGSIDTTDPINIVGGIALNENTIYDNPEYLTIEFDKPLSKVLEPALNLNSEDSQMSVEALFIIENKKLLIKPSVPLLRKTKYKLTINQAISDTGNSLLKPFTSSFFVSGGPKVVSHNTGQQEFSPDRNIEIKFDQNVNAQTVNLNNIALSGQNVPNFTFQIKDNAIIIKPSKALPSCTKISINITDKIQNAYDIGGDSKWHHTFKTLCRRTVTIGTSVQGRAINANWFGDGSTVLLFVGGIHGNEKSSVLTMESWMKELEKYSDRIPADKSIVVITSANPDGYASNSRFNSNKVDLNRNFAGSSWQANVSGPGYSNLINGGGTAPESEPETLALANFIRQHHPRAVFSYHATANLISPNYAGDSSAIANLYDSKASYHFANGTKTEDALGYTTTGDFEFWLLDIGIPNILIEQTTLIRDEINKNRDALWAMVGI